MSQLKKAVHKIRRQPDQTQPDQEEPESLTEEEMHQAASGSYWCGQVTDVQHDREHEQNYDDAPGRENYNTFSPPDFTPAQ